jgi:glycosyltransferase involved in cell wall biosynthesis
MNVSVCIATFNGEKYIEEQINSIITQLKGDWEIIVCDDDSKDDTVEIIRKINNPKIKIYKNKIRLGYALNFEKTIKLATKEYIFLSDQDDIWMENKVSECINQLKVYDMVISNSRIIDKMGTVFHESYFKLRKTKKGTFYNILRPGYLGCSLAFRKSLLNYILPFPKSSSNNSIFNHDYWIGSVGMFYFKTIWIDQPLMLYRRHTNNVSNGGLMVSNNPIHKILKLRIKLIFHLMLLKILKT